MPGIDGVDYNFCEVVPASISGYVFQDGPAIEIAQGEEIGDPINYRDGLQPGGRSADRRSGSAVGRRQRLPLVDSSGNPFTAVTDRDGYHEFTNLYPGLYTVPEIHPEDYVDGIDTPARPAESRSTPTRRSTRWCSASWRSIPRTTRSSASRWGWASKPGLQLQRAGGPGDSRRSPRAPPERGPSRSAAAADGVDRVAAACRRRALLAQSDPGCPRAPLGRRGRLHPTYSWHLSVINGGKPRQDDDDDDQTEAELLAAQAVFFDPLT